MKRYLNAAEKNQVCVIASLKIYLDDRIQEWEKLGRSKDLMKFARMTRSFADRVLQEMLKPLDIDEVRITINQAKKTHIITRTSDQAIAELKKLEEFNKVTKIITEDFETLCSYALDVCMKCTKCDYHNCELRRILMEQDLPALDTNAEPNQCQYQLKDLGENAIFNVYKMKCTGQLFRIQPGLDLDGLELITAAPLDKQYWSLPKITME